MGALLALGACSRQAAARDAAADEAAIRRLLDGVEQAFNSGDLQAGVAVFADDAVISGQGQPTDKASGQVVADLRNRHIPIFRRQPDGGWKTWRMMVNNEEAPP